MRLPLIFILLLNVNMSSNGQTLMLTELCDMPSEVLETSGLENGPDGCFWTHNDSGNPAELYCVDTNGLIQRTVAVSGDSNTDWEEIAKDHEGNLYIGNFGNNSLNRTDLHVVKIPSIDTCTSLTYVADTIHFSYPDQFDFPPIGDYGNFDMEAMVWYQDSLHLFSKDRSSPSTGYCKHYKLPAVGGTYVAELVDSLLTGGISYFFSVTGADLSEDNTQLVLLNSDRLWLCTNFTDSDFFGGDVAELELGTFTQKEGVCFRNGFIYVTDEDAFGFGGKMYRLHPALFVGINSLNENFRATAIYDVDYGLLEVSFTGLKAEWQLLNLDGKVILNGVNQDSISASELNQKKGVYVMRLTTTKGQKAIMIQL